MEEGKIAEELKREDYFYVPGSATDWKIVSLTKIKDIEEGLVIPPRGVFLSFNLTGFCTFRDGGQNIGALLEELGIADLSNKEIINLLKAYCFQENEHPCQNPPFSIPEPSPFSFEQLDWNNILFEAIYLKVNILTLAWRYQVSKEDILSKLQLYRKNLKAIKRDNRKFLNKRKKKSSEVISSCREFCERNHYSAFSAHDVKLSLSTFPDDRVELSTSTVRRILKKDLGMSFKKVNRINPRIGSTENKRQLLEAISIQMKLVQRGVDLIYIDEFRYSGTQSHQYTWVKRGDPGHYKAFPSKFSASFMIAVSRGAIHGVMANPKTYNQKYFKAFLARLTSNMQNEYALVLDNASIHRSKLIKAFCSTNDISCIFIPSYCPFVNMCEKVILDIKSKVRRLQRQGREISLLTFKKCMEEITKEELLGCERASFEETIKICS